MRKGYIIGDGEGNFLGKDMVWYPIDPIEAYVHSPRAAQHVREAAVNWAYRPSFVCKATRNPREFSNKITSQSQPIGEPWIPLQ